VNSDIRYASDEDLTVGCETRDVMPEIDLNSADESIAEVLEEGRNTPSNIARRLDYSREYVSQRLKRLREHGLVERVDRGLYELSVDFEDPPEDPELEPEPQEEADADGKAVIDEILADWNYGRSSEEKQANEKIARESLEWLRESGRDVRRDDVPLEQLADSDPLDRSVDTIWSNTIRSVWQHAVEQGYVSKPHRRAYRWIDE